MLCSDVHPLTHSLTRSRSHLLIRPQSDITGSARIHIPSEAGSEGCVLAAGYSAPKPPSTQARSFPARTLVLLRSPALDVFLRRGVILHPSGTLADSVASSSENAFGRWLD